MRTDFYLNFLARRSAVQAVYQQITDNKENLLEDILDKEHLLSETRVEVPLLKNILQKVLSSWDSWEDAVVAIAGEDQLFKFSRCAIAVLRCGRAEILEKNIPIPLIINEYIELSKLFCENEVAIINKILDTFGTANNSRNYASSKADNN